MPSLSILLHTHNDERTLGRALESLRPADEIVVVDQGSTDNTLRIADEYGARVCNAKPGEPAKFSHDWVFYMRPNESLSEGLETSLFEWKQFDPQPDRRFAISIREQVNGQWRFLPSEVRLVHRTLSGEPLDPSLQTEGTEMLNGNLLRFADDI